MTYVDVVYAPSPQQTIQKRVDYSVELTVEQAIQQSGLMKDYPEIAGYSVGIFSTLVAFDTVVKPGERVEVYRPLLLDPKEKRRQRAGGKKQ